VLKSDGASLHNLQFLLLLTAYTSGGRVSSAADTKPYEAFAPGPMNLRSDLQFWGGTTIMTVSASAGSKPRPITLKNSDEVYGLKWLDKSAIVFDRVADEQSYGHAHIWKASVPLP
jgi:hypothetical protein